MRMSERPTRIIFNPAAPNLRLLKKDDATKTTLIVRRQSPAKLAQPNVCDRFDRWVRGLNLAELSQDENYEVERVTVSAEDAVDVFTRTHLSGKEVDELYEQRAIGRYSVYANRWRKAQMDAPW